MEANALLKKADEYKKLIDEHRPLTPNEARQLNEYFKIGTTYTSNALEGNSLTLTETKVLLEDGLTVGGKPVRDCYEATGHAKAYDFMLEAAKTDKFTVDTICELHRLFYSGIDENYAGKYRNEQVYISGTEYMPPKHEEVAKLMDCFINELNYKSDKLHPLVLSAFAHKSLADIHPFIDGNGRTARLLMNLILLNKGYQVISIPPILRQDYINALEAARHSNDFSSGRFVTFIAECEIEAQKDYCRLLRIEVPKK